MRKPAPGSEGSALIELLVVVVILLLLAYFLLPRLTKDLDPAKPGERSPVQVAKGTVCKDYLRQARMSIATMTMGDAEGGGVTSLDSLRLPAEMTRCPEGGEAYNFDPQSRQVSCPHPGHEQY